MADHELIANDTEPPWEGYLDYEDVPALLPDGSPNPALPPFVGTETFTWVMQRKGTPSTVVTGTVEVVDAARRHVRHRFLKSETGTAPSADTGWEAAVQIDYADGRRHTHQLKRTDGKALEILIRKDLGGPA